MLALTCISGFTPSFSQNACTNPAYKGDFSLDKTRTCVGSAVTITNVPTTLSNTGYNFQYDGKSSIEKVALTTATSFTYTQPGTYTILQGASGAGSGTGTIFCREVTVLPLEPINFTAKACSGRQVTVNATLDAKTGQYDDYIIDWGNGVKSSPLSRTDIVKPQSYTYNNATSYTIKIIGRYAGVSGCDTPADVVAKTQQVVNLSQTVTQPVINKLTTVGESSISIQYQITPGTNAQLYQRDANGMYQPTGQTGNGTVPFSVSTDTKQAQCFQVVAQDACNAAGLRSDEVCSIVVDAQAIAKQNDLRWQAYQGTVTPAKPFRYYRVLRNGSPVGGTLTSRTATSYSDNNKIECGTRYCYAIEAYVGPAIVTSGPSCVTGINGEVPTSFTNIVVSIEDGKPRIVAQLPTTGATASYTINVSRASGSSGSFQPVGSVTGKNVYIDEGANPSAGSYCYQLTFQSSCGLSSPPSEPVCTVFLSSQSSASVDWTTESPFLSGPVASYTVEVIDSLNGTKREIPVSGNTRYEPDPDDPNLQSQKYRIISVSNSGVVSYSNFFTFRREAKILVPNAFTPNGDGQNDEFVAKGIYVDQFRMTIYDRWGSVIYSTTEKAKGWDGTENGQPALAGQYMYRIEVEDLTGLKTVRTGALLLIR
ncbi:hypothetical protein GCM10027341_05170 [Spirosoma knui]